MIDMPNKILNMMNLSWLTGPIFSKELRVASRRKRNYFLRMAFIFLLLFFLCTSWLVTIVISGISGAGFVSGRMSQISLSVTSSVVWMLFILLPVLAILKLSGSISQEINKRTLDVLLTTPISALQIVMGKFLSSLSQLIILIGITFPLFAIIRVFGGVPWAHVVVFLCITLTTTCLFGAISIFYSIQNRNAYRVVVWTVATGLVVFLLFPGLLSILMYYYQWQWLAPAMSFIEIINPFMALAAITQSMAYSDPQGTAVFAWATHCAIIIFAFMLILLLAVRRLHKNKPYLSMGKQKTTWSIKRLFGAKPVTKYDKIHSRQAVDVTDDPIYWKDLYRKESGAIFGPKASNIIFIVLVVLVYCIALYNSWLTTRTFHAIFVTALSAVGFIRIAILSAQSISTEKQARTLPILLMTPIEDVDIHKKKRNIVLKKTSLYWYLIIADVVLFSLFNVINPLAIIGVAVAIVPAVLFIMGTGFYFGSRLKTITATMTVTLGLPILLWFFCPCFANFSPLMIIAMSISSDFEFGMMMFEAIIIAMGLIPAVIYAVAGIVMLSFSKSSMRKYVFNVS